MLPQGLARVQSIICMSVEKLQEAHRRATDFSSALRGVVNDEVNLLLQQDGSAVLHREHISNYYFHNSSSPCSSPQDRDSNSFFTGSTPKHFFEAMAPANFRLNSMRRLDLTLLLP